MQKAATVHWSGTVFPMGEEDRAAARGGDQCSWLSYLWQLASQKLSVDPFRITRGHG
jgi:hypothetical protein